TAVSEAYAHELAGQGQTEGQATPLGYVVGKATALLPEELRRKLTAETDAQGNVSVPGVPGADNAGITVLSEAYGTQQALFLGRTVPTKGSPPQFPSVVMLRRVGRVTGRLVAEKPEAARGVPVTVTSQVHVPGRVAPLMHTSRAVVTPDAEGRF